MYKIAQRLDDKNEIWDIIVAGDENQRQYGPVVCECPELEMAKRIARLLNMSEHGYAIISNRKD